MSIFAKNTTSKSCTNSSKGNEKDSFFGIQAKLNIGKSNDKYEVEAERVADKVVSNKSQEKADPFFSPSPLIQKKLAVEAQEQGQKEKNSQQKTISENITPLTQLAPLKEEEVQKKIEKNTEQTESNKEIQPKAIPENTTPKIQLASQKEEEVQQKTENKKEDIQLKKESTTVEPQTIHLKPIIQTKVEEDIQEKKEDEVQTKEDESELQMSAAGDANPNDNSNLESNLNNSKGGGSPLPQNTKTEMESGFGADFSNVKVHNDSNAVQMNKQLGSQAFANGSDIYFNEGKYNPNSQDGKHLLAHELTHTVQQGASKPADQAKLTPEADKQNPIPAPKTETPIKTASEPKKVEEPKPATENKKTNTAPNATPTIATQEEKLPENGNATSNAEASVPTANPIATASNDAKTTQETSPVEEKAEEVEKENAKTDEKTAEIPAEDKKAEEVIVEEPSIERDPTANPAFQATVAGIEKTAKQQKENDPAEKLSTDAQAAAPSPSNERDSQAQANQVDEMEAQEPQVFSAEAFKAQLMARIAEMKLPKNNDEADNFEDHNNIDEVNKKATDDVKKEKDIAAGPIDQTTNKEPNTAAVPMRTEVPLPPLKEAPKPGSVGATKAIPDKRPDSEVVKPIEEDTARMDQTMAENKVTDEQLEKSEEPSFQEALGKKNEAKTAAQVAPMSLREQENAVLQKNASRAENASQKELEGMNLLRGTALQGVGVKQTDTSSKDTSERQRIADNINAIYEETKTDVTNILDTLETSVTEKFEAEAETAKGKFENYVDLKMSAYKSRRYSGLSGGVRWLGDLFTGLPDEVNEFFVEGREVFVNHMDGAITVIANIVANELTRAKNRIELGKQNVTKYVNELPANQKKFGQETAKDIQDKFNSLKEDVNNKQESLVDSLAQQYSDSLNEVDSRIEEMKAANKGLIDAALGFINGIIETIKKLRELISSLLSAIASVIEVIIAAPIEFMGNLFKGIGQGIDMFKANIQKHLLGGLLEWLTGSLGPMGITVPDDIFSLSGIFNLLMQVLGLGWDYIRMKAVKIMDEPTVKVLETGYDMFKAFATKGIDGIWEYLQESFSDLKETVIDAIKNMLITQVIEAGIKWLLSLLIPGAGFIKAIMAIKDVIVFFVESAIMLIPSIIEAILALAAGSVAGVAKAIEFGLAKLIPLVIGLFAKLIGLGGLSKKVMKIFTAIRKRVDKAINKLLMKAKVAGKKLLRKMGIGKKGDKQKKETDTDIEDSGNIAPETFSMAGTNHTLSLKKGVVYMASKKGELAKKLSVAEKTAGKADENAYDGKKDHVVKSLGGLKNALSNTTTQLNGAITSNDDKRIEKAQKSLSSLAENIGNFGTKYGFTDLALEANETNEETPTGILKQNKGSVHAAALSTVEKAVEKIDVEEAKKKGNEKLNSWSGLKNRIEETVPADAIHKKPITTPGSYGNYTKGQVNKAANTVLTDKTDAEKELAIKDKIANIEKNPSTLAFVSLRNQILDKSKENEVAERLEASFRGEEQDHDKYKPQNIIPSIKNNQFFLNFDYGEDAERLGGKRDFMVRFNLIDAQSGIVDQSTTGRNLTLKEEGTRGRTASAGELAEAGFSDLNSAHVLADWFEGSGYKSSLNLIATSAHYNQKIMGTAEKSIAKQITNFIDNNGTLYEISTNIQVDARWQAMSQDKIIETLKEIQNTKGMSPEEIQELANETYRKLQGLQFPRKCLQVLYRARVVVKGEATSLVFREQIGEDKWLKL
jgi:hypothetical protein